MIARGAAGRVMVVTAHPDDSEFGAGGTVAKLVTEGRPVTYVIVTNGNKGSGDRTITSERLTRIREEEQRRAARVLGVEHVEYLGYEDCEVEDTRRLRLDITRPDTPVAARPHHHATPESDLHQLLRLASRPPDHCIYPLARNHLSFPELLPQYEPHKVREVYLIQWEQPQLVVDITHTMDVKLKAIACHASQVGDFKAVEARVRARAAALGTVKGYTSAEGFDRLVLPD